MLRGPDDVDWTSIDGAYGSATEVPDLLRRMRFADRTALTDLRDLVHPEDEQTAAGVACVPFLLEIGLESGDRRRLFDLAASIAGVADDGFVLWADDDPDPGDVFAQYAVARRSIAERIPELVPLFDDPDPDVRRQIAKLLVAAAGESSLVLPALQDRYAVEIDPQLRIDLILAVAWAGRIRSGDPAAQAWLEDRLRANDDPLGVLDLLGLVLLTDPAAMPGRIVPTALAAARKLDENPAGYGGFRVPDSMDPDPESADALTIAEGQAEMRREDSTWWDTGPLYVIDDRLGDRLSERTELVAGLWGSRRWFVRAGACGLAAGLVNRWRGEHIELIRGMLRLRRDPDERVRANAGVRRFGPAVAPVLDILIDELNAVADPDPAIETLPDGTEIIGPELWAAAQTGDRRILPVVRRILERPDPPRPLRGVLAPLRRHTGELFDLMHRRMVDLADPADDRVLDLAEALGNLGERAGPAGGELLALLRAGADPGRLIPILGNVAYRPAGPDIRRYLEAEHELGLRIKAAQALCRIEGDARPGLRILAEVLHPDSPRHGRDRSAGLAATIGAPAAAFLPQLHEMLADRPYSETRVAAGIAIWRITGEPEPAVSALIDAVAYHPGQERGIDAANCLAEIGPPAAAAIPTLQAFLPVAGRVERRPSPMLDHPELDLAMIDACGRALASIEPGDRSYHREHGDTGHRTGDDRAL